MVSRAATDRPRYLCARGPGERERRHGPRLESPRTRGARQPTCPARARARARRRAEPDRHLNSHGDGAGRGLRRRQLDRPRASAVSRRTPACVAVSVARGRGGDRRAPRARRPRRRARAAVAPGGPRSTQRPLCRRACRHSRRHQQGRWDRGRGRRGRGNARGENERRQIRAVLVHRRRRGWRVASGPAGVRQRPVRMGGQRRSVRPPELFAVPDERPARAQERRLHEGIQRGEGPRGPTSASTVRVPPSKRRWPSSTPSMS